MREPCYACDVHYRDLRLALLAPDPVWAAALDRLKAHEAEHRAERKRMRSFWRELATAVFRGLILIRRRR